MNQILKRFSFLKYFLWLLAVESAWVMVYLIILPRDPKNSLLFGFSGQRLVLIGMMLVMDIVFTILGVLCGKKPGLYQHLSNLIQRPRFFNSALLILSFIWLAALVASQYPLALIDEQFHAYFERLHPILIWLWVVTLETVIFLTYAHFGFHFEQIKLPKSFRTAYFVISGLFALTWVVIAISGLGQTPDPVSWRELGSPLLAWQFWLAILCGCLLFLFEVKFRPKPIGWHLDAFLLLGLYTLALIMWLNQPLQNSYFSPESRPPNNEVYPYSDAIYYNLAAESVTAGEGLYSSSVTPRPYFLTILAYIVEAANGNYGQIIQLQTFLLALLPLALYLLGKQFAGRSVGLAVGMMAVFREVDAILATPDIQLSNSKMIMADLPTLLMMIVFTLLLVDWLKHKRNPLIRAALTGGCLGLVMLFRTQAVILLPFVLAMVWWQQRANHMIWVKQSVIFIAALGLMVSPWIIRNYTLTGQVVFDDPQTQTGLLQSRYQFDEDGTSGIVQTDGSILQALIHQPGKVFQFVANHFLRNEIGTILVTPPQRFIGTWGLLFSETPYWSEPAFNVTVWQGLQLALILACSALGIASAFSRWGLPGLAPLVINLAYTLGNALARNSGGRYNLPVDWIGYFYLAIGIFQIVCWCSLLLGNKSSGMPMEASSTPKTDFVDWKKLSLTAILILLVGAWIPLTEAIFPQKYTRIEAAQLGEVLTDWVVDPNAIQTTATQSDAVILFGRELYPRFYKPGVGEAGSNWVAYAPLDFCRMGFVLIGPDDIAQVIVTLDKPPLYFPNRSDVIVVGIKTTADVKEQPIEYIQAKWIIFKGNPSVIVEGLESPPDKCRLK